MFRCAEAAGLSLCEHLSPQYGRCRTLPIMLCCKTCRGMDRNEDKTTSDLHQPVCVTVCWWRLSHRKSTVAPAGYMKVFGFQRTEKCPLINTSWRNMLDHFTAAWTRDWVQSGLNSTCTAHQGASTHRARVTEGKRRLLRKTDSIADLVDPPVWTGPHHDFCQNKDLCVQMFSGSDEWNTQIITPVFVSSVCRCVTAPGSLSVTVTGSKVRRWEDPSVYLWSITSPVLLICVLVSFKQKRLSSFVTSW